MSNDKCPTCGQTGAALEAERERVRAEALTQAANEVRASTIDNEAFAANCRARILALASPPAKREQPQKLEAALSAWEQWYRARLARIKAGSGEDYTGHEQDLLEALTKRETTT